MTSPLNRSAQAGMGSGVEGRDPKGSGSRKSSPAVSPAYAASIPSRGPAGSYRYSGPIEWPKWRCPDCGCRSHARVDEQKPSGHFGPGPLIRCVECKAVFDTRPPPAICGVAPTVEFYQHDWLPGFAAFRPGATTPDGRAFCVVNLGALLSAVEGGDLPAGDLPYVIADSMMHEVIHAIEQWAGVEFSEERVEALLARYRDAASGTDAAQAAEARSGSVEDEVPTRRVTPAPTPEQTGGE